MRFRMQIIQPCMASCSWCGTFKKNPLFSEMVKTGRADIVHNEYKKLIKEFKPDTVYISGGEPLLLKGIDVYVKEISKYVKDKIYLFTSFQYPEHVRKSIYLKEMPFEKVVLTHTTAGFNRNIFSEMTGFNFDLYVQNIRELSVFPWQKRIKFILNNDKVRDEIDLFKSLVNVGDDFTFNLKLINEQSGSNALKKIKETPEGIIKSIKGKMKVSFEDVDQELTGLKIIENLKENKKNIQCRFKESPEEIRFSFYTSNNNGTKLKYRFCPFFPLEKHFKYKIGRDSAIEVTRSFKNDKWHRWCGKCRLKHYL